MTSPASTLRYADRYRVVRRIGAGGMATVYLAEDERLGRRVAVKRLHADSPEDVARRFDREARLGASLNHPNLVAVYDTVTDPEGVLIVMEYVDGPSLAGAFKQAPLAHDRALTVLSEVAAGLDHAHRHGIIHRDVKPANILLAEHGQAKLADLGIAFAAERATHITRTGTVLGTPSYMAPEQLEGRDVGPAVDVYALSAVAFEALSRRKARTGGSPMEIAHSIATEPAPKLSEAWPEAPERASEVLCQGMAFDPASRPASAGELVERLEAALEARDDATAATRQVRRDGSEAGAAPAGGADDAGAAAAAGGAAGAAAGAAGGGAGRAPGERAGDDQADGAPASAPHGAAPEQAAPDSGTAPEAAPPGSGTDPSAQPLENDRSHDREPSPEPRPARRPAAPRSTGGRTATRRPRPAWLAPIALLLVFGAVAVGAVLSSGGGESQPEGGDPGGSGAESGASQPSDDGGGGDSGTGSGAGAGAAQAASAPAQTVTSFYERAAADDFDGAWALAGPGFRAQQGGYDSFRGGLSTLESIDFQQAEPVAMDGDSAEVAIRTVATHSDGVDRCQGKLSLTRGGQGGWLIDRANVACPESTRG